MPKPNDLTHDQQELLDDYPASVRSRLQKAFCSGEKQTVEDLVTVMQGLLERENAMESKEFNIGLQRGIEQERGRVVRFIRTLAARHFLADDRTCELASRYKDMAKQIASGEKLADEL